MHNAKNHCTLHISSVHGQSGDVLFEQQPLVSSIAPVNAQISSQSFFHKTQDDH
jgi:hypothetical protein